MGFRWVRLPCWSHSTLVFSWSWICYLPDLSIRSATGYRSWSHMRHPRWDWSDWSYCQTFYRMRIQEFYCLLWSMRSAADWSKYWSVRSWRAARQTTKKKRWVCCIHFTAGDMWQLYWSPPAFLKFSGLKTGRSLRVSGRSSRLWTDWFLQKHRLLLW